MTHNVDRATGAFFLLFGLLLYFVIIPGQVEIIEDGWLMPQTIPNAMALVIAVCGGLLILRPTAQRTESPTEFLATALYCLLIGGGLWAMSRFGFVYTAPPIALAIMLLMGERRPVWLAIGVIGMPTAIWLLVVQLLDRALP